VVPANNVFVVATLGALRVLVVLFHVQPLFAEKTPGELKETEPATAGADWVTAALMTF